MFLEAVSGRSKAEMKLGSFIHIDAFEIRLFEW